MSTSHQTRFGRPPAEIYEYPIRQSEVVAIAFERELANLRRAYGGLVRARLPYGSYPFGDSTAWIAIGHEEVQLVLSDPRFTIVGHRHHDYPRALLNEGAKPPVPSNFSTMDGKEHVSKRRVLAKHLSYRRLTEFRTRVELLVDEHLERFTRMNQGSDITRYFSREVPVAVICDLLGVPIADRGRFVTAALDLTTGQVSTPEEADHKVRKINIYFGELHERRRSNPGSDLFSALIKDTEAGNWSEEELTGIGFLLLFAGHDATSLIMNGMINVLAHSPELFKELREDETLIPAAIEEFLRYVPAGAGHRARIATEDISVFGVTIAKDEVVQPVLHAANHDERAFSVPDQMDLTRNGPSHVRFGFGPHACAGSGVARMELDVVLRAILARFKSLTALDHDSTADWRMSMLLRGSAPLPVTWEAA